MSGRTLMLADGYGNYEISGVEDEFAIPHAQDYLSHNYNNAKIVGELTVLEKKLGKTIPFITYNSKKIFDYRKINFINFRNNMPEVHFNTLKSLDSAVAIAKSNNEKVSN